MAREVHGDSGDCHHQQVCVCVCVCVCTYVRVCVCVCMICVCLCVCVVDMCVGWVLEEEGGVRFQLMPSNPLC